MPATPPNSPSCWNFSSPLLDDHDHTIAPALGQFTASCYSVDELRADLARFAFLLGGSGERFVLGEP